MHTYKGLDKVQHTNAKKQKAPTEQYTAHGMQRAQDQCAYIAYLCQTNTRLTFQDSRKILPDNWIMPYLCIIYLALNYNMKFLQDFRTQLSFIHQISMLYCH